MTNQQNPLTETELAFTLTTLDDFSDRVTRVRQRAASPLDLENADVSLERIGHIKEKFQDGQLAFSKDEAKIISCALTNRRRFVNAMLDSDVLEEGRRGSLLDALRTANHAIRKLNALFEEQGLDVSRL